jgi:hypothetical protein
VGDHDVNNDGHHEKAPENDRRSALIHEEFSELGSNHGFTSDLFTTLLKLVSRLLPVQLLKGTVVVVLSPMIYGLEQNN